jgi:tetratricopeptide (TPR) repeat protein
MGSLPAEKPAGFAAVRIPPNGGAYLLYLRSMEMLHRPTRASTENALLLLRQATEQDGKIPEFFAATASVLATRAEQGWDQSDTALTRAKQLAAGAIALDPSISEGYRVLGNVLSLRKEFRAALTEFDNGLRYSPKSAAILLSRARVLLKLGKYQDAIAALGRAYDLSPRDPDLLQTFAVAQQLAGAIHRGSAYHLTAVQCADDSTAYLVGPFADAVVLDPELSVSQSERVAAACRLRLRMQPGDYVTMYRFARLLQVTGKPLDGAELLGKAETDLRSVLEHTPGDLRAMMYLALTLTRRGKFPEAADLALRAAKLDKKNPEVKYRIAQM